MKEKIINIYDFVKNNEIISLREDELNDFFKIPENKVFYYFDVESLKKFDPKLLTRYIILNEEYGKNAYKILLMTINKLINSNESKKIIKKLNKNIKKIDSNTKLNELINLFKKGIYTNITRIFGAKDDTDKFGVIKIDDEDEILNFIFNSLDIYDDYKLMGKMMVRPFKIA